MVVLQVGGVAIAALLAGLAIKVIVPMAARFNIRLSEDQKAQVKNAIRRAIMVYQQTMVKTLKRKKADGKITPDEFKQGMSEVNRKVIATAWTNIKEEGLEKASNVLLGGKEAVAKIVEEELPLVKALIPKI